VLRQRAIGCRDVTKSQNHKIIRSRDVIFIEKFMYKDKLQGKKQEKQKPEYIVLDEITEK
jgi:hypothetical protein